MNLGRQGRLPGRSGMLGAARRTSRGKGRDHGANVETCLGTNMVVVTMAIPSKIQKPPRITSEKVMMEYKIWRDKSRCGYLCPRGGPSSGGKDG